MIELTKPSEAGIVLTSWSHFGAGSILMLHPDIPPSLTLMLHHLVVVFIFVLLAPSYCGSHAAGPVVLPARCAAGPAVLPALPCCQPCCAADPVMLQTQSCYLTHRAAEPFVVLDPLWCWTHHAAGLIVLLNPSCCQSSF
jgi:hypothetical protein